MIALTVAAMAAAAWLMGIVCSMALSLLILAIYAVGRDRWKWPRMIIDVPVGEWLRAELWDAVTWPWVLLRMLVTAVRLVPVFLRARRNRGEDE